MGRRRHSDLPGGGVVLALLAVAGLAACASDGNGDHDRAANTYATAVADALADSEQASQLVSGGANARGLLKDLSQPAGVGETGVLDVGMSSRTDDAGNTTVGVDAAIAMTFAGRDEPTCALVAATSAGDTSAVVAPYIPLDACSEQAEAQLRDPFETAQELFNDL